MITFIDLAGHERYLKTTVFGMTGHAPDFAMLMVCGIYILSVNEYDKTHTHIHTNGTNVMHVHTHTQTCAYAHMHAHTHTRVDFII